MMEYDEMNPCGYAKGDSRFVIILKATMFAKNLQDPTRFAEWLGITPSIIVDWLNSKKLPDYKQMQILKDKTGYCMENFFE